MASGSGDIPELRYTTASQLRSRHATAKLRLSAYHFQICGRFIAQTWNLGQLVWFVFSLPLALTAWTQPDPMPEPEPEA